MPSDVQTHYEVLGIAENASRNMIREAYLRLADEWSADRHSDDAEEQKAEAAAMLRKIEDAYALLSDPIRRYNYDCTLHPVSFDDRPAPAVFRRTSRPSYTPSTAAPTISSWDNGPLSYVLSFLFLGVIIFCSGWSKTRASYNPDSKPVRQEALAAPVYPPVDISSIVRGPGVTPEQQEVCNMPRHVSLKADPYIVSTAHFDFAVTYIDYLERETVVHWEYRARDPEQKDMLLDYTFFVMKKWNIPGQCDYLYPDGISLTRGGTGKYTLRGGLGKHVFVTTYPPCIGTNHLQFIQSEETINCWDGSNNPVQGKEFRASI